MPPQSPAGAQIPPPPPSRPPPQSALQPPGIAPPASVPSAPPIASGVPSVPSAPVARYERARWDELPAWDTSQADAWPAWLKSCAAFRQQAVQSSWLWLCAAADGIARNDAGPASVDRCP